MSLYSNSLESFVKEVSYEYSYDKSHTTPPPTDYYSFGSDGVTISLHEGDKPFAPKQKTSPRTEMRFLNEYGSGAYKVECTVTFKSIPDKMQYSWMQVFDSSPNVMLRVREGVTQFLAFNSKDKITPIDFKPEGTHKFTIEVQDGKDGYAKLLIDDKLIKQVACKQKFRDKLHVKLGPYAQQSDPIGVTTITYHNLSITKL